MLLGTRNIAQGDKRRYTIHYGDFLEKGVTLKLPVVTAVGAVSTVSNVSLDIAETKLIFYIQATSVSEMFTVAVQVQDTNNEVVNDTIGFHVVAP
jgi:hypothetical protein